MLIQRNHTMAKTLAWLLVVLLLGGGQMALAQTKSKTAQNSAKPARSASELQQELLKTQLELAALVKNPKDLMDSEKRMELAGQAVPILKRMMNIYSDLALADPENAEEYKSIRKKFEPSLAILHDDQTLADLKKLSESKSADESTYAKATLLLVQYVDAPRSAIDQNAIIDDFEKLTKANPNNEDLVIIYTTAVLADIAAGQEQKDRWEKAFANLKSPMARDIQKLMELKKSLK